MDLGTIIKEYRFKNNLSLREFAERCNLSHSYIAILERNIDARTGKPTAPTLKTLKCIAKGMNTSTEEILHILNDNMSKEERNQLAHGIGDAITYTSSDDSMLPILGVGDIAYIYLKNTYDSEETILFKLDNKEYVRKIIDKNDTVEFQAMNQYYPTIGYTKEELKKHNFTVIGKVIQVQNTSAFK